MDQTFEYQLLTLSPNSDQKMWVAEIVGDDPVFRLKRAFLPEFEKGVYHIYDGVYQIHGIYPGITPFEKEYCQVVDGHMQRRIPVQDIYQKLDQIKAYEPVRMRRLKYQIQKILDEIGRQLDNELVQENISYQKDQLDNLEDSLQLTATLNQLIKQKDHMIRQYQKLLEQS